MAEWKPFDLKWGRNIWYCTACEESTEVPTYLGTPMYNFCPMCGANMNMKTENKQADTPQTEDDYFLELMDAVKRGEMSDASANQAYYEYINKQAEEADTPQMDCYVSDLCKHYGDKQICGRCRSRNMFCKAEPQPRCPKCGKRGYIRSLESMGVKLKVFDEYKWKCTNCNNYFKEEPKDEPQTDCD